MANFCTICTNESFIRLFFVRTYWTPFCSLGPVSYASVHNLVAIFWISMKWLLLCTFVPFRDKYVQLYPACLYRRRKFWSFEARSSPTASSRPCICGHNMPVFLQGSMHNPCSRTFKQITLMNEIVQWDKNKEVTQLNTEHKQEVLECTSI
jgi:hypothetical protein